MELSENQFKGVCKNCGGVVKPGEGFITGKNGGKWALAHKHVCTVSETADDDAKMDSEPWASPAYTGPIDMDYHGG